MELNRNEILRFARARPVAVFLVQVARIASDGGLKHARSYGLLLELCIDGSELIWSYLMTWLLDCITFATYLPFCMLTEAYSLTCNGFCQISVVSSHRRVRQERCRCQVPVMNGSWPTLTLRKITVTRKFSILRKVSNLLPNTSWKLA